MRGAIVRAWLVSHHALAFWVTTAALTTVLMVFWDRQLPGLRPEQPIPIWQLTPPALALLASVTTGNRIPTFYLPSRALCWGRALWLLTVVFSCAGAALVVDLSTGFARLAPGTATLVALTFGLSAIIGYAAVVFPAALAITIVLMTQSFAAPGQAVWGPPPWAWPIALVLAGIGCALYVRDGARNRVLPVRTA